MGATVSDGRVYAGCHSLLFSDSSIHWSLCVGRFRKTLEYLRSPNPVRSRVSLICRWLYRYVDRYTARKNVSDARHGLRWVCTGLSISATVSDWRVYAGCQSLLFSDSSIHWSLCVEEFLKTLFFFFFFFVLKKKKKKKMNLSEFPFLVPSSKNVF